MIVDIALPVPINKNFSYNVPERLATGTLVGRRAVVPFGRRTMTGMVVGLATDVEDLSKLKDVEEFLDEEPVFTEAMMKFTKWMSDYYHSSWGEAIRAAIPQGFTTESYIEVRLAPNVGNEQIAELMLRAPKMGALLQTLAKKPGFYSIKTLEKKFNSASVAAQIEKLRQKGLIELQEAMRQPTKPLYRRSLKMPNELINDEAKLKTTFDRLDKTAPKQSALLGYVFMKQTNEGTAPLAPTAIKESHSSQAAATALIAQGLLEVEMVEVDRNEQKKPKETLARRDERQMTLNPEQQAAFEEVRASVESGEFQPYLLHGITGSGKTLVYLRAIERAIELGKTAIVIVPEISLTPQLLDRFVQFFPGIVSMMHSRMSAGERFDSWNNVRTGRSKIVIGARSAIFAPLENVGLIIVDEEHEQSFKQESPAPRYQGRDCALVRGKMENATVVLGSATPSLESMYNAKRGRFKLLEIKSRADNAVLPTLRVVDVLQSMKTGQLHGAFTKTLLEAIVERANNKQGVIIFQNRRGFSSFLFCPDCGYIPLCNNCDVSLTYHKREDLLNCHYCGYSTLPSKSCPVCGYPELEQYGTGTQKIEDDLKKFLTDMGTDVNIARMDLDTTSTKDAHRRMLQKFAKGDIDILIGTQMVTKGLDFENVTLVGVINADLSLFMPDFRSTERTYQLITQVAGRAGRSAFQESEVIIQTYHPEHIAIKSIIGHPFEYFFDWELNNRKYAKYPPYSRFCKIEFQARTEQEAIEHAREFARLLPQDNPAMIILGPTAPTLSRLRSIYRQVILIKNIKSLDPRGSILHGSIRRAQEIYSRKFSSIRVKVIVDIDAYSSI
ncbi:MAG: primosomal protein N' [Chloroflexota bacterium]